MPAASVDDYIAAQPEEVARYLTEVRAAVLAAVPDAPQVIRYGIPSFLIRKGRHFYVGAWKHHVGIYPIYPLPNPLEARVAPLRSGVDTVRLPYGGPAPAELITAIVRELARA